MYHKTLSIIKIEVSAETGTLIWQSTSVLQQYSVLYTSFITYHYIKSTGHHGNQNNSAQQLQTFYENF